MTLNEIVLAAIPIILTALLGWITPYLTRWLDAKIGHEATIALTNFAYAAVQAAEKRADSITGPEKKAFAEAALKAFATDKKYKVTNSDIEVLVEAAVHQLKNGFGFVSTTSGIAGETTTTVSAVPVVQVAVAGTDAQSSDAVTVPVTGEEEIPAAEVPNPVTDEVPPETDPVLDQQEPVGDPLTNQTAEPGAKTNSVNWS
jgi:LL-H family phage holin